MSSVHAMCVYMCVCACMKWEILNFLNSQNHDINLPSIHPWKYWIVNFVSFISSCTVSFTLVCEDDAN